MIGNAEITKPMPIHGYLPLPTKTMSPRLLTSTELGKKLNRSLSTIHNRISPGKPMPPAMKIGGELIFPEYGLQNWLDAQRLPTSEQPLK
jgi:hypothetical protein